MGTDEGAGGGRETVEVEIALREGGGPAALGISVKSKTRDGPLGPDDLGVFIKSVISGGAAARVSREPAGRRRSVRNRGEFPVYKLKLLIVRRKKIKVAV